MRPGIRPPPPTFQILYSPPAPTLSIGQQDNVFTHHKDLSFTVNVSSAVGITTTVLQKQGAQFLQNHRDNFTVAATLAEGNNTFEIHSVDCAGLESTAKLDRIFLDTTLPVIQLGLSGPILTRTPLFSFPISVTSESGQNTVVYQNDLQIAQSAEPSLSVSAMLEEGLQIFVVTTTDPGRTPQARHLPTSSWI